MYNPVILSVFKPPLRAYQSEKYPVLAVPVRTHHSYISAMRVVWDSRASIINIEHDIQASDENIDELLACPEPACTFAYRIYSAHLVNTETAEIEGSHPQASYWCQYDWISGHGKTEFRSIEEGTGYSVHSGLGFCKLATHTRPPLDTVPWHLVESEINKHIRYWHIHWPAVQHWHK